MTNEFRLINQVYETEEYDMFSYRIDNRDVSENIKLREEIKACGILVPIIVNEKYEVIDGQHRVELAKSLKKPIPFVVIKGAGKKEIISINTTSKQWLLSDFINSYAHEGIEEYETMSKLLNDYDVSAGALCCLAFNTTDTGATLRKVREGQLEFVNLPFLVSFLDFYQELIDNTTLENNSSLPKSLYTIYRLKNFDQSRIFDKSGLIAERLKGVTKQGMTTQIILECYNMRLRVGSGTEIKYHKNAKGNIQFYEDLKDEIRKEATP